MAEKPHFEERRLATNPPSMLQKFFAVEWVWTVGFAAIAVIVALSIGVLGYPDLKHMLVLTLAGAAGGTVLSWAVVRVVWEMRIRINGGPFREGDWVQVIRGRNAGRIVRVYETWPSRNQVRLDMGESAQREKEDFFLTVQVCHVYPPCCDKC
ncbi:MAG: hypothetical protein ACK45B_08685 [Limisphaerales bacterium]|jgi:hypothetical protein